MQYPSMPRPSPSRSPGAMTGPSLARPLAALSLALALLLPGGALPASAADTPADIDACPLLTAAEVGTAFDETVEAAEQEPMGGGAGRGRQTLCFWTPEGGALGATVSLAVWSWPPGHPGAAGSIEAMAAAATPGRPAPEAVAIGDEAVWDGDRLHVRLGSIVFTLAASRNALDDAANARPALEALARKVVQRLP